MASGRPARVRRAHRAPILLDAVLLLLVPFIQLGTSYYGSVAMLLAALAVIRLRGIVWTGLKAAPWGPVLAVLMFASLLSGTGDDPVQDVLRVGREAVIAVLMIAIFTGVSRRSIQLNARMIVGLLIVMTSGLLLLTLVQAVALRGGVYVGVPAEWFVTGSGTIPGEKSLYYSKAALRPSGTFAEPSYLAFVMLSFMMIALASLEARRTGMLLLVVAVLCGLASQAASFVLFAGLIGAIYLLQTGSAGRRAISGAVVILAAAAVLLLGTELGVIARVAGGFQAGGDASIFARIFGPLQALPDFLAKYPFGQPMSLLPAVLYPFAKALGGDPEQFLMNGLLNLFFAYGVIGLPLAVALLMVRGWLPRLYVISCMMFNGAFLAIDKLALVALTLAIYESVRRGGSVVPRSARGELPRYRTFASAIRDDRGPRPSQGGALAG